MASLVVCSCLLMHIVLSVNKNNKKAIILVIAQWDTGVQVREHSFKITKTSKLKKVALQVY